MLGYRTRSDLIGYLPTKSVRMIPNSVLDVFFSHVQIYNYRKIPTVVSLPHTENGAETIHVVRCFSEEATQK